MCAAPNSLPSNLNSPTKTKTITHGSSTVKSNPRPKRSRDEKRKQWAKNNKPKAKPSVKPPNAKEYISACCSVPARKPAAGTKETYKDAESGKMKTAPKGLGKWRCGQCGKTCKVSAQRPQGKEYVTVVAPPGVMLVDVSAPREAKNSAEIAPIKTEFNPPALETIVLTKSFPIAPPGVITRVVTFGDVKVALPGPSSVMDGEPDVS